MKFKNHPILVVDDDEVDILTITRAVKKLGIENPVEVMRDGEEALSRLCEKEKIPPALILLDVNMPRMGGLELLQIIKQNAALCSIPTVMLTSSKHDPDKTLSFENGAAGYMIKPIEFDEFVKLIEIIDSYWSISEMPLGS